MQTSASIRVDPRKRVLSDYALLICCWAQVIFAIVFMTGPTQLAMLVMAVLLVFITECMAGRVSFRINIFESEDASPRLQIRCQSGLIVKTVKVDILDLNSIIVASSHPDIYFNNTHPCDFIKLGESSPAATDVYLLMRDGSRVGVAVSASLIRGVSAAMELQKLIMEFASISVSIYPDQECAGKLVCPYPLITHAGYTSDSIALRKAKFRPVAMLGYPCFSIVANCMLAAWAVVGIYSGAPVWMWFIGYFFFCYCLPLALVLIFDVASNVILNRGQRVVFERRHCVVMVEGRPSADIPYESIVYVGVDRSGPEYISGWDRESGYVAEGYSVEYTANTSRLPELIIAQATGEVHRIGRGCELVDLEAVRDRLLGIAT